jgi:hypothetical protein
VKLWSWSLLRDVDETHFQHNYSPESEQELLHPKESLKLHASRQGGVTDIAITNGALYSAGSDGVVRILGLHG